MATQQGIVRQLVTKLSFGVDWKSFLSIKKAVSSIKKDLTDFAKLVSGAGKFLVSMSFKALAAFGSFSLFAKVALESERNLIALAEAGNTTYESAKKLQTAFDLGGFDNSAFQQIFQNVNSQLDLAKTGYGDLLEITGQLGIDIKDTNGKILDTETSIKTLIDYLRNVKNPTTRGFLFERFFGVKGTPEQIQNFIDKFDIFLEKSQNLSPILGAEDIQQMERFFENLRELKVVTQNWATEISKIILPGLNDILKDFLAVNANTRALSDIYKDLSTHFDNVFNKWFGEDNSILGKYFSDDNPFKKILDGIVYSNPLSYIYRNGFKGISEDVDKVSRYAFNTPILKENPDVTINVTVPPGTPQQQVQDVRAATMEAANLISESFERQIRQMKDSNPQMSY